MLKVRELRSSECPLRILILRECFTLLRVLTLFSAQLRNSFGVLCKTSASNKTLYSVPLINICNSGYIKWMPKQSTEAPSSRIKDDLKAFRSQSTAQLQYPKQSNRPYTSASPLNTAMRTGVREGIARAPRD